jgi:predicted O-methyltransferase YrrM
VPYDLTVPGWMSETNLQAIEQLAARVPTGGNIVEIGSFCGRSARAWALSAPRAALYCIDTWNLNFENLGRAWLDGMPGDHSRYRGTAEKTFHETMKDLGNVTALKGLSTDPWPVPLADIVFLDGDHSRKGVLRELELWEGRLTPNGLLCGDDFRTEDPWIGVIKAVTDFARGRGYDIFVPAFTTLWILFASESHRHTWWP